MELKLQNISKQYNKFEAVKQVDYIFTEGIYGILGANGAGKSTIMKMMSTVLTPTDGKIFFNEKNIYNEETKYRSKLGVLPQDFGYYKNFTVYDFVEFMGLIKGVQADKLKDKVNYVLELTNLTTKSSCKIQNLSGGMRQRVGIAQALVNDPKVLILDEPTVGLDPEERVSFRNNMAKIGKDKIVLISTHIVQDVEYMADKLVILKEGRIIRSGKLSEILLTIEGKVWEYSGEQKIREDDIVCNIRNSDGQFIYRVISNSKPSINAINIRPTLDDLYLYYFHERIKGE